MTAPFPRQRQPRAPEQAITGAVFKATGYRLELEKKQIPVSPDAYFLKSRMQSEIGPQPAPVLGLRDSLAH